MHSKDRDPDYEGEDNEIQWDAHHSQQAYIKIVPTCAFILQTSEEEFIVRLDSEIIVNLHLTKQFPI